MKPLQLKDDGPPSVVGLVKALGEEQEARRPAVCDVKTAILADCETTLLAVKQANAGIAEKISDAIDDAVTRIRGLADENKQKALDILGEKLGTTVVNDEDLRTCEVFAQVADGDIGRKYAGKLGVGIDATGAEIYAAIQRIAEGDPKEAEEILGCLREKNRYANDPDWLRKCGGEKADLEVAEAGSNIGY